jgi:hypothetical protein
MHFRMSISLFRYNIITISWLPNIFFILIQKNHWNILITTLSNISFKYKFKLMTNYFAILFIL